MKRLCCNPCCSGLLLSTQPGISLGGKWNFCCNPCCSGLLLSTICKVRWKVLQTILVAILVVVDSYFQLYLKEGFVIHKESVAILVVVDCYFQRYAWWTRRLSRNMVAILVVVDCYFQHWYWGAGNRCCMSVAILVVVDCYFQPYPLRSLQWRGWKCRFRQPPKKSIFFAVLNKITPNFEFD